MRFSAALRLCLMLVFAFVSSRASAVSAQQRYPAPADMQTIHLILLKTGPNASAAETPETQKIQDAHLAHITKLAKDGHALIAGPIGNGGDLQGLIFMKAASLAEAKALESEDPAVKAGRLTVDGVSFITPGNWFSFGPVTDNLPMRRFVFGFLNTGPNRSGTPEETGRLMDDHLANLWAMREAGTLVLAGPAEDNAAHHEGIFVIPVDTIEKAKELLAADPTVKAGRTVIEAYQWYAADRILKGK